MMMLNVILMKCVFAAGLCSYVYVHCWWVCVFIWGQAGDVSVSTASCLPVWWKRAGGGRSEGCARLLWQVPAVWMQGKSCQDTHTHTHQKLTHTYSQWFYQSFAGRGTTITHVTKHFNSITFHVTVHDSSLNSHSTAILAQPERINQAWASQRARLPASAEFHWSALSSFSLWSEEIGQMRPIKFIFGGQGVAPVSHCMRQPFFSTNHQIPQWSQIILIPQLFRVFAFVCLAHQMGGSLTFGSNSLDDIMPGRSNQSQKVTWSF